jgi:CAAX prenyl protease-like protein
MTEREEHRNPRAASTVAVDAPMLGRAAWPRILPFLAYVFFIFAGDMLARLGYYANDLRWLYPVKIAIVALLLALFWKQYEELRSTRLSPKFALIAIAVGIAVFALWISLDADWMIIGSPDGYDPRVNGRIDWPLAMVRIAGAALVVPVMEELFWRSFLMRWIVASEFRSVDPSQVGLKSFVITIVLFGFEHNLWLAGMVAGAVYGWLYTRHQTLWSPIVAHAVTNGLLGLWVVSTGNWSYW